MNKLKNLVVAVFAAMAMVSCAGVSNNSTQNDPAVDANINKLDSIITVEKDFIAKAKAGDMDATVKVNELQYEGKKVVTELKEQAAAGKVSDEQKTKVENLLNELQQLVK